MPSPSLRDLMWLSDAPDAPPRGFELRGRQVTDANGESIGLVDDALVDEVNGPIRFIRIVETEFYGGRPRRYLVPIDAVVRINNARVRLDRDKDQVADAPAYDPDRLDSQSDYLEQLYDYYEYQPYWEPGYVYPMDLYRP
jgi:sporulation protein YlmC with PRC-barrel domain